MESDHESSDYDEQNTSEGGEDDDLEDLEENGDLSDLGAAVTVKMENTEQKTFQKISRGDDKLAQEILKVCQVPTGELVSTSGSEGDDDKPGLPQRDAGRDKLSSEELVPTSGLQEYDAKPPVPPRIRNTGHGRLLSTELVSTTGSKEHDDRPTLPPRSRNTGRDKLSSEELVPTSGLQEYDAKPPVPPRIKNTGHGRLSSTELVSTTGSQDHDVRPPLPPRSRNTVIQCNFIQQKVGNVTVKGTQNLSIGGTLNVNKTETLQTKEPEKKTWADQILERTISKMKNWTTGMAHTSSLKKVMEKLNTGQTWITIKGSPGEGKSTVAFMALEKLHAAGEKIFQVTSPFDFYNVIKNYPKPIILLDDIFGELEFDQTEWTRWKSVFHHVLDVTEHRSHEVSSTAIKDKIVTVILVGRDYVLNSASTKMGRLSAFVLQDSYVINMSHCVERDHEEKIRIWKAIVNPSEIKLSTTEVNEICNISCHHGFPHVCRLFVTIYKSDPELSAKSFFQNPLEFLNITIREFFTHKTKLNLFKDMVRSGGRVMIEDLGNAEDGLEKLRTADELVGTYLRYEENYILFDHPSIYDSVAFNLYNLAPLFVIQNCELSFIHHRLRLQPITEMPNSESTHVIQVPKIYHEDLAKRFADEISQRNFSHVLSHDACTNDVFIHKMMSHISVSVADLIQIGRIDEDPYKSLDKTFLSLTACNKSPQLLKYIADQTGILEDQYETKWVLFGICKYAASDILHYLKDNSDMFDINAQSEFTGETPLMIAAQTGNSDFVQEILSFDPDINAEDFSGKTALDYLSENGIVSAVKHIFATRTDIDLKSSSKKSPLWWACQTNEIKMIDFLIEKGASLSLALLYSLEYQDTERLESLLKRGADVNVQDEDGWTPLHTTVQRGWTQFLDLLLKAGADVNVQDNNGRAPLYIATAQRSTEYLHSLISAGANVNIQTKDGFTPIHLAALDRSGPCMDLLLKAGADVNVQSSEGYTPLYGVISNAYGDDDPYHNNFYKVEGIRDVIACTKLLLNTKADVNKQNIYGITPLHVAMELQSVEVGRVLLQSGADVDIKSETGDTALHTACCQDCSECAALLLQAGAAVNTQNENGWTPLHCAVQRRSKKCVEMLSRKGSDANVQSKSGETPIHIAATNGETICTNLLLERGANVNVQDAEGNSPLHKAAILKSVQGVEILLTAGADINTQNNDGFTPLHKATEAESLECVKLLVRSGADVNITDHQGQTLLHKAVYRKQGDILEVPDVCHCEMLIRHGADVNVQDSEDNSPLHLLCQVKSEDPVDEYSPPSPASSCEEIYSCLINLFVDHGANIGLLDKRGQPALHGWCKTLIQLKVQTPDGNTQNLNAAERECADTGENGETPLHTAVHSEQDNIVCAALQSDKVHVPRARNRCCKIS